MTTRCHSVFSRRSPVALSRQLSEVATLRFAIGRPSWVRLISGSLPRLPTRMTLFAGAASAADFPARPAPPPRAPAFVAPGYNWSGFYIGINGGGAWAHKCWTFVPALGLPVSEGCHSPDGGMFGGQVGFNWQTGPVVFGVELSGDWTSLKGSNVSLAFPLDTNRTKVDALASVTGRVGYAWDAVLLYAKGGGAWVNDKYDGGLTATGALVDSASEPRTGWTAGGGLEY